MKEQYIEIDTRGNKIYYSDKSMTVRHREDGPAVEWTVGSKEWWVNGERHREDGPAVEWANGIKCWYVDGKRHREDGPAVEDLDYKEWWVNGKEFLTEDEFNDRNKVEFTLNEIAEKFCVSVDHLKIKK